MDRSQCAISQTRITTGWTLSALVSTTFTCPCASTNHYANLHGVRNCSYIPMAHGHGHPSLKNPSCPFRLCPFHGMTLSLNTYALPTLRHLLTHIPS